MQQLQEWFIGYRYFQKESKIQKTQVEAVSNDLKEFSIINTILFGQPIENIRFMWPTLINQD